ncbi:MAG: CHRD domain-containing protein [Anaerolineae bacterium]|nr:CHRD domain-containing protein [Anaerolineae bacterium]
MTKQTLKFIAAGICAIMLGLAGLGSAAVWAQETATPVGDMGGGTSGGGPMSMMGACTPGMAAALLPQAGMMVSGATMEATTDAGMDMATATTDMGAMTPEATMDMSMATAEATVDPSMMITEPVCFVVYLTGAAEVPGPGDPDGYGVAAISFDPTTNVISFEVAVSGLTLPATASHIHMAPVGESGDVVVPANGMPDANGMQLSTSDPVDPALLQSILANPSDFYFNVHTSDYPGGAVRGQLTWTDAGISMPSDGGMMATMEATPSQ